MDETANAPAVDQVPAKKGSNTKLLLLIVVGGLVVLGLIIVFLASFLYLGVFNVGTRVPEQCNFPVGLLCTSVSLTPNTVSLTVQNGMGSKISICNIVCDDTLNQNSVPLGGANGECTNTLTTMSAGESKTLPVIGSCRTSTGPVSTGSRYSGKVFITYLKVSDTGDPRVAQGVLQATVK